MKREIVYCEVQPKIVPADRESTVEIRPLFNGGQFRPGQSFVVSHILTEDTRARLNTPVAWERAVAVDSDGVLRVRSFFEGEQEHVIRGVTFENSIEQKTPCELRVYSVADDLLARRPWKGDLHIHSSRSDGMEPPAYVAAASRRIGLDFMAVTDHHRHAPSLEAIAAFADAPHDLRIYPGEEVHPNGIHIVNFGGRFGITDLLKTEECAREVAAIQRSQPPVRPGVDPAWSASTRWTFDKIREAGGLGVFCHPYWTFHAHYSLAEAYIEHLFETEPFDAFELIGGFNHTEPEANLLQVTRYHEERSRGRIIPVVGASDAHGCERGDLFGWYYTIAFAPSLDLPDLIRAVKTGYSVAVEALPGQQARPHGPFRLVKYALFLLREVLPLHDQLCAEEGRLMHRHLAHDTSAHEDLARATGRCGQLYDGLWSPTPPR